MRPRTSANREFGKGLARAFAGAILFGLPLLMTMEMWRLGFSMEPWKLIFRRRGRKAHLYKFKCGGIGMVPHSGLVPARLHSWLKSG